MPRELKSRLAKQLTVTEAATSPIQHQNDVFLSKDTAAV